MQAGTDARASVDIDTGPGIDTEAGQAWESCARAVTT
jgi:hypothetical protein